MDPHPHGKGAVVAGLLPRAAPVHGSPAEIGMFAYCSRKSYERKLGHPSKPLLLADLKAADTIEVMCTACRHWSLLAPHVLLARFPAVSPSRPCWSGPNARRAASCRSPPDRLPPGEQVHDIGPAPRLRQHAGMDVAHAVPLSRSACCPAKAKGHGGVELRWMSALGQMGQKNAEFYTLLLIMTCRERLQRTVPIYNSLSLRFSVVA